MYNYYSLFLDDVRQPKQVTWVELPLVEWVVVKNFDQFIAYIKLHGCPTRVSFDHDLAPEHYKDDIDWSKPLHMTELTGMDCVKWLVDYCIEHNHTFPEYYLHTLNNQGKLNMESYISSYKKSLT
jgi:hypothetical protein